MVLGHPLQPTVRYTGAHCIKLPFGISSMLGLAGLQGVKEVGYDHIELEQAWFEFRSAQVYHRHVSVNTAMETRHHHEEIRSWHPVAHSPQLSPLGSKILTSHRIRKGAVVFTQWASHAEAVRPCRLGRKPEGSSSVKKGTFCSCLCGLGLVF